MFCTTSPVNRHSRMSLPIIEMISKRHFKTKCLIFSSNFDLVYLFDKTCFENVSSFNIIQYPETLKSVTFRSWAQFNRFRLFTVSIPDVWVRVTVFWQPRSESGEVSVDCRNSTCRLLRCNVLRELLPLRGRWSCAAWVNDKTWKGRKCEVIW